MKLRDDAGTLGGGVGQVTEEKNIGTRETGEARRQIGSREEDRRGFLMWQPCSTS